MEWMEAEDYQDMSEKAGEIVLEEMRARSLPTLGLATGSTPEGLYQYLIMQYQRGKVSYRKTRTFNLDEYVDLPWEHPNSYYHYMKEKFFSHVDVQDKNTYLPDGMAENLEKECMKYESEIAAAGGVVTQVLGLGGNGHIGFNEPGTPFDSRTHVVDLKESTRRANARFFPSLEEVPKQAITMGIETIMESKRILLLVSGRNKREALARLMEGEVSEEFPASVLWRHPNVQVIADREALGK
ncbi:glucosamine-6-phosphate deaminase [Virgibacillus xinjiangensis]|uniref:Glucosamine-6-phosphate deaminase n=1 Tax=Virgibacillus xinjiangensis TaxID=393090 RepID=A0ABV7CZU5_9BACI